MKKAILLLILTSLFFSSCSKQEEKKVEKFYKTVSISTWSIENTETYVWYVKWKIQTMLATKAPWKITYLAKKVWDRVYKWELLASLDSAEAKTNYATADSIVDSLYALRESTIKSFDEQIKATKEKIAQAEAWLKWITTWLNDTKNITKNQIETAKLAVQTAKTNLEETKKTLATKKENILAWAKSAITQNIILSENIIDFVDKFLGITEENKHYNDRFEDFIWAKDLKNKEEAKALFKQIRPIYLEYKKYYKENIEWKNPSEQVLISWLKKAINISEKLKKLLDKTYDVLDDSVPNTYLPLSMINSYKAQVSKFWSQLEQTLLSMSWDTMVWLKWTLENLKNFESQKQKAISLLEKQLEIAKQQLAQYESMASWKVNEVSTKKEIAEKQLQEAKAWLQALIAGKQAKLKELDSKIAEASWKRNLSAVYISDWKIYSPINWVIVSKMAEIWQVVWAWMPIYTVASDKNVEISIDLPKFITDNLKLYQKVWVEINNKSYTWTITELPNVANMITKKIPVKITVNNSKRDITIWAMAKVKFKTKIKNTNSDKWLLIPQDAIVQDFMIPWVYIIENNKAKLQKINIISCSKNYCLVNWLKPNSTIITQGKENIYDWEILK